MLCKRSNEPSRPVNSRCHLVVVSVHATATRGRTHLLLSIRDVADATHAGDVANAPETATGQPSPARSTDNGLAIDSQWIRWSSNGRGQRAKRCASRATVTVRERRRRELVGGACHPLFPSLCAGVARLRSMLASRSAFLKTTSIPSPLILFIFSVCEIRPERIRSLQFAPDTPGNAIRLHPSTHKQNERAFFRHCGEVHAVHRQDGM